MSAPPLKSPTCGDCAKRRGLVVPGDMHTCWQDTCANCGRTDAACSPASDWRLPGVRVHPDAMD